MAVIPLDVAAQHLADKIGVNLQIVLEKLTLDTHTKLTERTPVDTGRARASWQISEGAPSTVVPPPTGVKSTGKNSQNSSPPANTIPPPTISVSGTQPVFITSAVDYMKYLEEGSSKQAPAGMVQITVREIEAEVEQTLAALNLDT